MSCGTIEALISPAKCAAEAAGQAQKDSLSAQLGLATIQTNAQIEIARLQYDPKLKEQQTKAILYIVGAIALVAIIYFTFKFVFRAPSAG